MIITKTPLRISLFGGGTDLPAFYTQGIPGEVLSFTIDKYIYICVNPKFDGKLRVSYSQTENVGHVDDIRHELVRETLRYLNIQDGLEITSISDIPGEGSGLGSSSAFTVGLLMALAKYERYGDYAKTAWHIENGLCGHPVGKQDQWAAANGGLNRYVFNPDGSVETHPVGCDFQKLVNQLLLFYLGRTRKAKPLLMNLEKNLQRNESSYQCGLGLGRLAHEMAGRLEKDDFSQLGTALDTAWEWKTEMSSGVSDLEIDHIYRSAKESGALGGKVCGAGGGGFMLFCVPPERHEDVKRAVGLRHVPFLIDLGGSRRIYDG